MHFTTDQIRVDMHGLIPMQECRISSRRISVIFCLHISAAGVFHKGRTIKKLMGGEVQKKYSRKGKLNENKFMHAN